jgi:hypothetical protein
MTLWIGLLLRDMSNEKYSDLRVDAIDSRGVQGLAPLQRFYVFQWCIYL